MARNSYDAIIADSDLDTRMRLKQAASSVTKFGKVNLCQNLREALGRVQNAVDECDVVFIAQNFDDAEIRSFIEEVKKTKIGQDAAFVLVLKTGKQDSANVAKNMMIGADGQLFEPYSVDQLMQITELAARVKKERAAARESAALRFLVSDIMNQIDLIAYMKSSGYEVGVHHKKFKEICSVLGTLSPESFQIYTGIAVDMFEGAPLPKKIFQRKAYSGASSRVKKKMEEKLLASLTKPSDAPPKA
jgi:DNA-binding NarL/FixJ family response regulator